jgi:hypothetical protein
MMPVQDDLPSIRRGWMPIMTLQVIAEPISTREETLESLIEHRLGSRIRDVRVVVKPMGLILQGRAATYHAKQLAQHAAMEQATLPILCNEIEVR